MTDDAYRKIFSKNLKHLLEINNKTQLDLITDLELSSSTVSNWCTGIKLPRMSKIQMLADYFRVELSDLLEERSEKQATNYYLNDDAREMAEFMFKNPEYKVLFDATRKVKKEDIDFVKQMIDRVGGMTDDGGC